MSSLIHAKSVASKRGGKCLSPDYTNARHKMKWQCKHDHVWSTTYDSVRRGSWCKRCSSIESANRKKLGIKQMRILAKTKGGECLSIVYTDNKTKLEWKCAVGHVWHAVPSGVAGGTWCPKCSGNLKYSIADVQSFAMDRGGKCLSDGYKGSHSPLVWKCENGHTWRARFSSIIGGTWCPSCSGKKRLDISIVRQLAHANGGKLLSNDYVNSKTPLHWECTFGHKWSSSYERIKGGAWCQQCGREKSAEKRRLKNINVLIEVAITRGGKLVSKSYKNDRSLMTWECSEAHQWKASAGNVLYNKTWCSQCSPFLSERICRIYFETIFGRKFPKSYPTWLKSPSGRLLELDGYCKSLRLAFEHQGEHHYTRSYFGKSSENLKKRKSLDRLKRQKCKMNDVTLVLIPSLFTRTKIDQLAKLIIKKASHVKTVTGLDLDDFKIDLSGAYSADTRARYNEMVVYAKSRGGRLLEKAYLGAQEMHEWECCEGHRWKAQASAVVRTKTWCAVCAGVAKYSIDDLYSVARSRGGICLAKRYKGANHSVKWMCSKKHVWKNNFSNIKRGQWCRLCKKEADLFIE